MQKGQITLGCVIVADLIVVKRVDSSSDVAVARRIGKECVVSGSRIETTVRVRLQVILTRRRVSGTGAVAGERKGAIGGVVAAGGGAAERIKTLAASFWRLYC